MRVAAIARIAGIAMLFTTPATIGAQSNQYREWVSHCTIGSLTLCTSISVSLRHTDVGGIPSTTVVFRMANLEGRDAYLPTGPIEQATALRNFNLYGFNVALPTDFQGRRSTSDFMKSVIYSDGARWVTSSEYATTPTPEEVNAWSVNEWNYSLAQFGNPSRLGLFTDVDFLGEIVGCDYSAFVELIEYAVHQTCSGHLEWNFQAPGHWTFTDNTVAVLNNKYVLGTDTQHVTPEPASIVLLGSGIAGLAGMRRWRHRRDGEESSGS
jgi:hypothetical protein